MRPRFAPGPLIPFIFVVAAFALVYGCTIRFFYIEVDDAFAIAYHAFGRNTAIQGIYGIYMPMMNKLLSVLPADEASCRTGAYCISAFGAIAFVLTLVLFARSFIKNFIPASPGKEDQLFFYLLLLIIPELFFFGLNVNSNTFSVSFLCLSNLLFLDRYGVDHKNKSSRPAYDLFVILLFGLGTSFRWESVLFIFPFLTQIFLLHKKEGLKQKVLIIVKWGLYFSLSFLAFIYLCGSSIQQLIDFILFGTRFQKSFEFSMILNAVTALSWLTPAFCLVFGVGLLRLIYSRNYHVLIILLSVLLPLAKINLVEIGNPKRMIIALPFLISIAFSGLGVLHAYIFRPSFRYGTRLLFVALFCILLLLPWITGIKIYSTDTVWGPGFEVENGAREVSSSKSNTPDRELDKEIGSMRPRLVFGGGMACPTSEGIRPMWGYLYVLMGGEWISFYHRLEEEKQKAIDLAIQKKALIIQDEFNVIIPLYLYRRGYSTRSTGHGEWIDSTYRRRIFVNDRKDSLTVIIPRDEGFKKSFDQNFIASVLKNERSRTWIAAFQSTSNLTPFKKHMKDISNLGPFSCIGTAP